MKRIITGILLIMPLIAFSQKYQVDKGKLETLLQAYFYTLPACDSTVIAHQSALQKADSAIHSGNRLILLRTHQRDLKVMEVGLWQKRFENSKDIHKSELKQAKKKGFRSGAILTGSVSILLIIFVL